MVRVYKNNLKRPHSEAHDAHLLSPFVSASELGQWDESMKAVRPDLASQSLRSMAPSIVLYSDLSGVDFGADAFRNALRILSQAPHLLCNE